MKWIEQYPVAWRVALIVLCFLLVAISNGKTKNSSTT